MNNIALIFLISTTFVCSLFAWSLALINSKRINKLEKKLQDKVIDIYAAVAHDDNILEDDIKELKDKTTFLASTNDVRLINNHINRVEARIDRLAEIINGKRKVK